MRTARISDSRREHLRAEFVPKLRVRSFHRSDSEGTIVTIERHSSDRLSADPLYKRIYARSTRTGLALLGSSCCTESIIVFTPTPPEPPRFGPRLKFWRTTTGAQAGLRHKIRHKIRSQSAASQAPRVVRPLASTPPGPFARANLQRSVSLPSLQLRSRSCNNSCKICEETRRQCLRSFFSR
jgi:hypothetical protein